MAWTAPKTNWKATDFFNLDPDYSRIKGNLLWLKDKAEFFYGPVDFLNMGDYTIEQWPNADFLNHIVENVQALQAAYTPKGSAEMRTYQADGRGWNDRELNVIETNCLLLYQALIRQQNALPKLPLQLGLSQI